MRVISWMGYLMVTSGFDNNGGGFTNVIVVIGSIVELM